MSAACNHQQPLIDFQLSDVCDPLLLQLRVFAKSGVSRDRTFSPRSVHPLLCGGHISTDLESAGEECLMAVSGAVSEVLRKVSLRDVCKMSTNCE